MKKPEFSKVIIAAFGTLAIIITVYTMAVVWHTGDTSHPTRGEWIEIADIAQQKTAYKSHLTWGEM